MVVGIRPLAIVRNLSKVLSSFYPGRARQQCHLRRLPSIYPSRRSLAPFCSILELCCIWQTVACLRPIDISAVLPGELVVVGRALPKPVEYFFPFGSKLLVDPGHVAGKFLSDL